MDSPNVLLLVLDSVRAKNTSLHGHINETTPNLREFAEGAVHYEFAYAPSIHSISSHASIFTGTHENEHGATAHGATIDTSTTIWKRLNEEYGYETGLFTPNPVVTKSSNLGESFEHVYGPKDRKAVPFPSALSPSDVDDINSVTPIEYAKRGVIEGTPFRTLANGVAEYANKAYNSKVINDSCTDYFEEFLNWSDSIKGPWAACINVMDAHYPYEPDSRFDKWGGPEIRSIHRNTLGPYSTIFLTGEPWWKIGAFESLYDGAILQIDSGIGKFISQLQSRCGLKETLIVITSDHGEGFGERSRLEPGVRLVDHSWGIAEELIRVPLVVKYPGQVSGDIVERPASLTEFPSVVETVLDGSWNEDEFSPDRPVIASTDRYQDPMSQLPTECTNPADYRGPWRTVIQREDGRVLKYATRGESEATFEIHNAQTMSLRARDGRGMVEQTFDELIHDQSTTTRSDRVIDDDVQRHLRDLGYVP